MPCVIVDAAGFDTPADQAQLSSRVRAALSGDAPAVLFVCASGEPLLQARARLRELDAVLSTVASAMGARVSRSATDGLAAWAASLRGPIGVDVQCVTRAPDNATIQLTLHRDEQRWMAHQPDGAIAFARLWSAKEATLKAFGVGLAWSPAEVCVLPMTPAWRRLEVAALGAAWLSEPALHATRQVALAVAVNAGQPGPRRSS